MPDNQQIIAFAIFAFYICYKIYKYLIQSVFIKPHALPEINENDYICKPQNQTGQNIQVLECFATWCPPCKGQVPHLNQLSKQYEKDVYIVSCSSESKELLNEFVKQHSVKYNIIKSEIGGYLMSKNSVSGIPHAFLFLHKTLVWQGHPQKLDGAIKKYVEIINNSRKDE